MFLRITPLGGRDDRNKGCFLKLAHQVFLKNKNRRQPCEDFRHYYLYPATLNRALVLQEIVRQCQRENPFAQKRLYDRYADRLYRLCRRYVRNPLETEEVLMNGFLKIFKAITAFEYRSDDELEVWMKRIVVNEALMHLRKTKKEQWLFADTDLEETTWVAQPATAEGDLHAEGIHDLILRLPDGYRTVFCLHTIEGYTHREIGTMLNISENTSKSQLFKARAALQGLLIKNGYSYEG